MRHSWWLRLLPYIRPHLSGVGTVGVLVLATIILNVLKPWPLKLIIDSVLGGQPYSPNFQWLAYLIGEDSDAVQLGWLAAGTVLLFVLGQVVGATKQYVQTGVGSQMVYHLGGEIFDRLQRLSLRYHNGQSTGDLVRRVSNDATCIRSLIFGTMFELATSLVTLFTMFVIMWQLDRTLSLLALVAAPLILLLIRIFTGSMEERAYEYQEAEGEVMSLGEQILSALPIVQSFNREQYETERYRQLNARTLTAYLKSIRTQIDFEISVNSVTAISTAVMMGLGGLYVLQGELTVGGLVVFLSYLASLHAPMQSLAYLSGGFASATANARRVFEVLDAEDLVAESSSAIAMPRRKDVDSGHVQFKNVTFGYQTDVPILRDISLDILPKQTIAIVGESGAGKSTLISLLPRLFDPWKGSILIDGTDIKQVKLDSLRSQVAVLFQEPFLLPLSVAENIAYARPTASREEIRAASLAAGALNFIENLPDGFDTIIGERGATLSGGEQQRLAIARAFLKDAPILILDEPTSALDAETEAYLLDALNNLVDGRTTFIIAHRLSTVRNADRIIVLNKEGQIAEQGTHEELVAANGLYARFNYLQSRHTEPVAG